MGGQSSDERLVELASQGSGDAFDQLVARYQDRVYNLLLRMSGSDVDAEELCQETFIRAWRALGSFRQGSRFFTWIYRIALNAGFTQRRDRSRRQRHEAGSLDAVGSGLGRGGRDDGQPLGARLPDAKPESDPVRSAEAGEVRARVQAGLLELEEDYRRILLLRDIEGLDYEAIAETIEISHAAVKSRLHRARRELARVLKDLKD
jgi:RNA polymerase sigma-70 factor (ECF subfamily)